MKERKCLELKIIYRKAMMKIRERKIEEKIRKLYIFWALTNA